VFSYQKRDRKACVVRVLSFHITIIAFLEKSFINCQNLMCTISKVAIFKRDRNVLCVMSSFSFVISFLKINIKFIEFK
jgi:hypothetical protein